MLLLALALALLAWAAESVSRQSDGETRAATAAAPWAGAGGGSGGSTSGGAGENIAPPPTPLATGDGETQAEDTVEDCWETGMEADQLAPARIFLQPTCALKLSIASPSGARATVITWLRSRLTKSILSNTQK
jgi:hypothetical protein